MGYHGYGGSGGGLPGDDGRTVLNGVGAPSVETGVDGDFYIDTAADAIYGPKTSGAWGLPNSLVGPAGSDGQDGQDGATGAAGATGADGKTVRNGSGAPAGGLGVDGDFYIDAAAHAVYGPRTGGAWGSPVSLIGPAGADGQDGQDGADGAPGAPGAAGADGKTVRNGAGSPAGGLGVDGDFYIDTTGHALYGPKTGGAWGSPTSLVGPQGQQGAAGADGQDGADGTPGAPGADGDDGVGVPVGGTTGQLLRKKTDADHDTEWATASGGGGTPDDGSVTIVKLATETRQWLDRMSDFGDGSDGALTISSDTEASKIEYQVTSLTIDAGHTFSVPLANPYSGTWIPWLIIRSKGTVTINGTISATGKSVMAQWPTRTPWSDVCGSWNVSAGFFRPPISVVRDMADPPCGALPGGCTQRPWPPSDYGRALIEQMFWPTMSGGDCYMQCCCMCCLQFAYGYCGMVPYPGYLIAACNGGVWGNWIANYDGSCYRDVGMPVESLVGAGRPFRFAAGMGSRPVPCPALVCGSYDLCGAFNSGTSGYPAAGGGGVIVIVAPEIVFGASGSIEAKGDNGVDADPGNVTGMLAALWANGGGGGGMVETRTRIPLSSGDKAKVLVTGGAGIMGKSSAGLDGVKYFLGLE